MLVSFNEPTPDTSELAWFYNQGLDTWSLTLQNIRYQGDIMLQPQLVVGLSIKRPAVIDTGSTLIKMSNSMFQLLKNELKRADSSLEMHNSGGLSYLATKKSCLDIQDTLAPLSLDFDGMTIDVKSEDYLLQDGGICRV